MKGVRRAFSTVHRLYIRSSFKTKRGNFVGTITHAFLVKERSRTFAGEAMGHISRAKTKNVYSVLLLRGNRDRSRGRGSDVAIFSKTNDPFKETRPEELRDKQEGATAFSKNGVRQYICVSCFVVSCPGLEDAAASSACNLGSYSSVN